MLKSTPARNLFASRNRLTDVSLLLPFVPSHFECFYGLRDLTSIFISTSTGVSALPGCNPVQGGPGRATPQDGCGATTEFTPGGPAGADPAVSPPTVAPPAGGGGAVPPFQGGSPPAVGGGGGGGGGGGTVAHYGQCGGYVSIFLIICVMTS